MAGRDAAEQTKEWRRNNCIQAMYKMFDENKAALTPFEYSEYIWDALPYIGGAPVGTCSTGTLTSYGPALCTSTGRIHFAGTETSYNWAGYMEGALRAGKRAAQEVLTKRGVSYEGEVEVETKPSQRTLDNLKQLLELSVKAAKNL